MKNMITKIAALSLALMLFVAPVMMVSADAHAKAALALTVTQAHAEEVSPAPAATPAETPAPAEVGLDVVFGQIVKAIGDWKSIGWQAGLAMLLTALVSTLKNTFLRQWIWAKVPEWAKILVAPVLSVIIFALGMGASFSWAAFFAAITTGVAAVYLHQILDALKKAPWLGEKWVAVIDFIGKFFGKQTTDADIAKLEAAKQKAIAAGV